MPSSACWRTGAIQAAVLWGAVVVIITESLSLFGILTRACVAVAWTVVAVAFVALMSRRRLHATENPTAFDTGEVSLETAFKLAVLAVAVVIGLTGLVAFIAPPNTWDSMAYHMARVAHWAQNGTVRHYPTPYLPQLYHPPWAEFAITHFQLLSGGDRFANAVQWLAMIGSVLCTSLITKLLGGDSRAQIFAAVLAATVPMGILQGSSTQNDLVVTFWLLVFVSYVLRMMASSSRSEPDLLELRWQMMVAGASLGLAVLTKGTAYIYAMPFVLWLAFVMVKRLRLRAIPLGLVAGALVLLLNAGHFWRNVQLFGTPLSAGDESYVNEVFTPSAFVSNFVRNLSLHAGTPFAGVNEAMSVAVRRLHDVLGIAVNDPRTTAWNGRDGRDWSSQSAGSILPKISQGTFSIRP